LPFCSTEQAVDYIGIKEDMMQAVKNTQVLRETQYCTENSYSLAMAAKNS